MRVYYVNLGNLHTMASVWQALKNSWIDEIIYSNIQLDYSLCSSVEKDYDEFKYLSHRSSLLEKKHGF